MPGLVLTADGYGAKTGIGSGSDWACTGRNSGSLTHPSRFTESVQPLQARREQCQSTWLCNVPRREGSECWRKLKSAQQLSSVVVTICLL